MSQRDGTRHHVGHFDLVSLEDLRRRAPKDRPAVTNRVRTLVGDARALHADSANAGATFQVASQFNALEMTGPEITP